MYTVWHGEKLYSQIHVDYLRQDKTRVCEIIGTKGTVVWKSHGKNPESVKIDLFDAMKNEWKTLYMNSSYDVNDQYISEVKYVINQIESDKILMNGLDESISLMKVLDKVTLTNQAI